ncbi:MAG: hypothetical protein ACREQV_01835, partial [Candidatus Binatia bacterium]
MKRYHVPGVMVLGLTILSCAGETSGGLTEPGSPAFATALAECSISGPLISGFTRPWPCGGPITVRGTGILNSSAIQSAVSNWNAMQDLRRPRVPFFQYVTGPSADIEINSTTDVGPYCGHSEVATNRIFIGRPGQPACQQGTHTGDLV